MIELTIQGEPVALGRGRAAAWRDHTGKMKARVYTPTKSRQWKERAALEVRTQYRDQPLEGPLTVEMEFLFRCPASETRKRKPKERRWHAKRVDLDNAVKLVGDALNGLVWRDDAQVCELVARKYVAAQGEAPRVVVRVRRIEEAA